MIKLTVFNAVTLLSIAACMKYLQKIIESTQSALDELDGVTTVHSRFYELSSDYYKLQGDHANYYREALRFLGCIDVKQLPKERQHERAYSLSLAALLGTVLSIGVTHDSRVNWDAHYSLFKELFL